MPACARTAQQHEGAAYGYLPRRGCMSPQTYYAAVAARRRDRCLHAAGFTDIFKTAKDKEDKAALQLLPSVLADLDSVSDPTARMEKALRGVFAGGCGV